MSYGGSPGAYELLEKGLIRPSSSLWGCPAIFVKRKDMSLCMFVDYRPLNAMTIKNKYPLPRIDILFDLLSKAMCYPRLVWGLVTIKSRFGREAYLRQPFPLGMAFESS